MLANIEATVMSAFISSKQVLRRRKSVLTASESTMVSAFTSEGTCDVKQFS